MADETESLTPQENKGGIQELPLETPASDHSSPTQTDVSQSEIVRGSTVADETKSLTPQENKGGIQELPLETPASDHSSPTQTDVSQSEIVRGSTVGDETKCLTPQENKGGIQELPHETQASDHSSPTQADVSQSEIVRGSTVGDETKSLTPQENKGGIQELPPETPAFDHSSPTQTDVSQSEIVRGSTMADETKCLTPQENKGEIQELPHETPASDHSLSTQTDVSHSEIVSQGESVTINVTGDCQPDIRQLYGICVFNRKLFFAALILVIVNMVVCMGMYFTSMKGRNFSNGAYFCVVTLCTVGYGDIHPENEASKIWIMMLAPFSVAMMCVVSKSFGNIVKVLFRYLEEKMPEQVKKMLKHVKILLGVTLRRVVLMLLLLITIMMPALFVALVAWHYEHYCFLDCFYLAMITAATVGYGDLSFKSSPGRVILSMVLLPYVLSFQYTIQKLIGCIVEWFEPLEESKIYEQIGVEQEKVSANDFVVCTLVKTRQISIEKVKKIHAAFKKTHSIQAAGESSHQAS